MSVFSKLISQTGKSINKAVTKVANAPLIKDSPVFQSQLGVVQALTGTSTKKVIANTVAAAQKSVSNAQAARSLDLGGLLGNLKPAPVAPGVEAPQENGGLAGFWANTVGFLKQSAGKASSAIEKIVASPMQGNASIPDVLGRAYDVYQRFTQYLADDDTPAKNEGPSDGSLDNALNKNSMKSNLMKYALISAGVGLAAFLVYKIIKR